MLAAYQPDGQAPISSAAKAAGGVVFLPDGTGPVSYPTPRALEEEEIPKIVEDFRLAARNVIRAGNVAVQPHNVLMIIFWQPQFSDRAAVLQKTK